ncbi:hypothetical protein L9F63_010169 [Diploptera punctata]|uniref:Major facilitator superfamily (MFS) profile domain-containing protein n=1 Tax=Diploptera punctata TaxID=6984 RepID=A0AAD8AKG8_DIPPU|nr:hypothetical protein L9F63_010169 [Diploptera punctata]
MVAEVFGTAFLIPAAECEFNMGPNEKGVLNAICYIGMITSSHLWGYLADTKGRRKMLILALLVDGICSFVSSLSHAYWLFVTLRFLNGFFICAPSAVVFAYLGEFHSQATRTRAVLFMSVFLSLGGLLSTSQGLAWLLIPKVWTLEIPWLGINYSSWRVFIVTGALPSFVAAFMLTFLLPESPKYLFTVGKEQEALNVLRYVFSMNTGKQPDEYPVTQVSLDEVEPEAALKNKPVSPFGIMKNMWDQTKPLFQKRYVLLTSLAFIMQFSFYASFNGFAMWVPDIYNRYAMYSEIYPNQSFTICESIEGLKLSTIPDSFIETMEVTTISYKNTIVNNINEIQLLNSSLDTFADFNYNLTSVEKVNTIDDSQLLNSTLKKNEQACISTVNPVAFRNSIIIGVFCMCTYSLAGIVIKFVDTKLLMAGCLLVSSISGFCIYFARTEWLIVMLCSLFIAMSGTCVNMLNSIVIDRIPTQLRAMAVCLSLMSGRLGVTVCSLVMGVLLETYCGAVYFMLGGIVLFCCLLSFLVPNSPKS